MKTIFVVQHEYEWCERDIGKFIGVYATRAEAEAAVSRIRLQKGFCDWPDGFSVDEYKLGEDHWTEGFATMVNILVETTSPTDPYIGASCAWHPGDRYEICYMDDAESMHPAFAVGDIVRCTERNVDNIGTALVAAELIEKRA